MTQGCKSPQETATRITPIVNTIFNSCSYVIVSGGKTWLVDCGDVDRILPLIHDGLSGVLLTHAHFDHIYGLNLLLTMYPDVTVYTNEAGLEGLSSDKLNFSRYHEEPFIFDFPHNVSLVDDGQMLDLSDVLKAKAVYTPGHGPDCVTWVIGDAVFSGDSLIPGVKTVTNLPLSDKALAAQSESLIRDLAVNRTIYPGHHKYDNNFIL